MAVEQERSVVSDPEFVRLRRPRVKRSSLGLGTSSGVEENADIIVTEYNGSLSEAKQDEGEEVLSCPLEQNHQGKKLLHVMVALPVDYIFSMIFVQDQVMLNVYEARKTSDVVSGPWSEDQETGHMSRQVTYTMSLNLASFGSKTSYVVEKQWLQYSQAGQCYVVATEVVNNGIPYGDSFSILCHYCLIREPDGRTKVTVWTLVKYKKAIWGVVKGMLEKSAYNGVEAFQAELLSQITLVVERSERKGNRLPPASRSKTHARSSSYGYKRQRAQGAATKDTVVEDSNSSCSLWITISMIMAFVMLILSNYILYNKLNTLEMRSEQRALQSKTNRFDASKSFEDRQSFPLLHEEIQSDQMQTWKATVQEASQRLLQIQESLELTLKNIRENEEAVYSTLQKYRDGTTKTSEKGEENGAEKTNTERTPPTEGTT
ncbi:protein Aster-C-like [Macrobrachium nipponense]|uniref:protein Aster-C-like n=1 Tax=Macrobrachium nipponense TaxID=159736 RepID=UPI0030C826B7